MPIEIRELIIKTEVQIGITNESSKLIEEDLSVLKKQLLTECKRILIEASKRQAYKR